VPRTIATNTRVDRAQLLEFIRPRHHAILMTTRRDGRPQASPNTCGVDTEGRIVISTYPERGLIDFPALAASGATYLLCWLDGEDAIEWWHWPDAGFAGRTPIDQPPA